MSASTAGTPARRKRPGSASSTATCITRCGRPRILHPYLPARWREHLATYGSRQPAAVHRVPRPISSRRRRCRAATPGRRTAGRPGSDLAFLQEQLLDRYGIETRHAASAVADRDGPAQPGVRRRAVPRDQRMAACEWTAARTAALKAAIVVARRRRRGGGDGDRALGRQSRTSPRSSLVTAHDRAAGPPALLADLRSRAGARPADRHAHVRHQRPCRRPAAGWPSFYIEEHHASRTAMQALVTSLVIEGVFERFPPLAVVMVEGGFAWVPRCAGGWTSTGSACATKCRI